jgi:hypothetical protein
VLVYKLETTQTECSLIKDGICIEKFKVYYKIDRTPIPIINQLFTAFLCLSIVALFAHTAVTFRMPFWLYFLILGSATHSISAVWAIKKRLKFIIERTT